MVFHSALFYFFGEVFWPRALHRGPSLQSREQTDTVKTRFLQFSSIFHFPNYNIPSLWTRFKFSIPLSCTATTWTWEGSHKWWISKDDKGGKPAMGDLPAQGGSPSLDPSSLEPDNGSTGLIHRAGREQKGFDNDLRTPGTKHAVGAHRHPTRTCPCPQHKLK